MTSDSTIPKPALWFGLAGLIPFVTCAVALWTGTPVYASIALQLQAGYAAVILSFLGGVHWGRALAGDRFGPTGPRLMWAILPSLMGWILFFVPQIEIRIVGFAVAFSLAYIVDVKAVQAGMFPDWYKRLRKVLTTGVLVTFILTLTAGVTAVRL